MSVFAFLAVLGGLSVVFHLLKLVWKLGSGLRQFFLSELWTVDLRTYGQWAVVTGATSGIGRAYASELAHRGLDVVLVSRCDDKLQRLAKEIENKYGRKTRTIQVDFTEGPDIYPAVGEALEGLEIGILVNNVGMTCSEGIEYFMAIPNAEQKITQLINCNMLSVTQMTRLVLPGMIERSTGMIINISSDVAARLHPFLTLYAASKSFVTYFSRCLNAEYTSKGITVQCVAPLMVSTNMTGNRRNNLFIKSPSGFAREALNTVGHCSYTNGCLSHALQSWALTTLLPNWLSASQFLISKLSKHLSMNMTQTRANEEKEKLREKEE